MPRKGIYPREMEMKARYIGNNGQGYVMDMIYPIIVKLLDDNKTIRVRSEANETRVIFYDNFIDFINSWFILKYEKWPKKYDW